MQAIAHAESNGHTMASWHTQPQRTRRLPPGQFAPPIAYVMNHSTHLAAQLVLDGERKDPLAAMRPAKTPSAPPMPCLKHMRWSQSRLARSPVVFRAFLPAKNRQPPLLSNVGYHPEREN